MIRDYWPTQEWRRRAPEQLGMKQEFTQTLDRILTKNFPTIDGLIVVRKGYIAYEKYQNNYDPNATHHVASVAKSILSASIGIAIDRGYIKSIDQKIISFFPEYEQFAKDPQKQDITLRHLLTMTAPYPFRSWREPLEKLCAQEDWVQYSLQQMGEGGVIGDFKYSNAGTHILSAVLTRCTGKNLRDFSDEYLFQPIGMEVAVNYELRQYEYENLYSKHIRGWIHDPHGNSAGGWGLTLPLYDMARFGFLYLNQGLWAYQNVVPKQWVEQSTESTPYHYGFLWWLFEENEVKAYAAMGTGGNVICCIPQLDMVVAIVATHITKSQDLWSLISKEIVSAVEINV